jgi:hypothetical protein
MSVRSRNWSFTLNNPAQYFDDVDYKQDPLPEWPGLVYRCYQLEVGENGTEHFQGWVTFSSLKTLAGLKKICPHSHWQRTDGKPANWHYCQKPVPDCTCKCCSETPVEHRLAGPWTLGTEPTGQGKRTDLAAVAEEVLSSGSLDSVPPDYFVRYHRGLEQLLLRRSSHRTTKPTVYWFWGPTGTGKSRTVRDSHPIDDVYWVRNHKWWDGYSQQPVVCIDDLRSTNWPFEYLLHLLDWYPMTVEVKGCTRKFNSPTVYITAPGPPDFMYQHKADEDHYSQLVRRIDEVRAFLPPSETE